MEKVLNNKGCVGVLDYNLAMKNTEHNILMKSVVMITFCSCIYNQSYNIVVH